MMSDDVTCVFVEPLQLPQACTGGVGVGIGVETVHKLFMHVVAGLALSAGVVMAGLLEAAPVVAAALLVLVLLEEVTLADVLGVTGGAVFWTGIAGLLAALAGAAVAPATGLL